MRKASVIFGRTGKTVSPDHMVRTNSSGAPISSKVSDQDLAHLVNVTSDVQLQLDMKNPKLVDGVSIRTVNNTSMQGSGPLSVSFGSSLPSGVIVSALRGALSYPDWVRYEGAYYPSSLAPDLSPLYAVATPTVSAISNGAPISGAAHLGAASPGGVLVVICKEQYYDTLNEVWHSEDDGVTWNCYPDLIELPSGFTGWERMLYQGKRLYLLSNEKRILFSDDDGFTWVTTPDFLGYQYGSGQSVVGFVEGRLYALPKYPQAPTNPAQHKYTFHKIWHSDDGGVSWVNDTRTNVGIRHYEPGDVDHAYWSPVGQELTEVIAIGGSLNYIEVFTSAMDLVSTDGGVHWMAFGVATGAGTSSALGGSFGHYTYFIQVESASATHKMQAFLSRPNDLNGMFYGFTTTSATDTYKAHVMSKDCFLVAGQTTAYAFCFHDKPLPNNGFFPITLPDFDVLLLNPLTNVLHCLKRNLSNGVGNYFTTSSRLQYSLVKPASFQVDSSAVPKSGDYIEYIKARS